ncbi:hypothetical protein [Paenibacillus gallinarum]|nr:hypothetical protein [Paenibacillus gallinarum]
MGAISHNNMFTHRTIRSPVPLEDFGEVGQPSNSELAKLSYPA